MKLRFTAKAIDDLGRLHEFVAEKNPAAADRIRHQRLDGFRTRLKQPLAGKLVKSLPVRQWVVGDTVVRYLLQVNQDLFIVRIWHEKEDRFAEAPGGETAQHRTSAFACYKTGCVMSFSCE